MPAEGSGLVDLSGEVVLITGAGRGLGRGIAFDAARAGAAVVVAARRAEAAERICADLAKQGAQSLPVVCDTTSSESVDHALARCEEHFGPITGLVNNAGILTAALPQELSRDSWDSVIETNLTAPFLCAQRAFAHFRTRGRGKVVNIASIHALSASVMVPAYGVAKAGLLQLTMTLAHAWAEYDIQVNAVVPGVVATDMTASALNDPITLQRIESLTPAGKIGTVGDVAQTVAFFLSRGSDFVTGQSLAVDGGILARDPMYGP